MDPSSLSTYQHPRRTVMGQYDPNSVPDSILLNDQMGNHSQWTPMPIDHANFTHREEQQHYNQPQVRKEFHEEERTTANHEEERTTANLPCEDNDNDQQTTIEIDPAHLLPEENDTSSLPGEEIKTEDDKSNFMEAAYGTFLKINSKEITIKEAADLLGRPYSFVYIKYDEFCNDITGKSITTKNKKGKGKKKGSRRKRKVRKLKHTKAISKTPGRIFQCENCPAVFCKKRTLDNHSKLHSGIGESHPCTACGIVFSKVYQLMSHRIEIHEDALQCPYCADKQYTDIANYKLHLKSHIEASKNVCEHCGKFFPSKPKLEAHYRTHTGEKPLYFTNVCEECGKGFHSRPKLEDHYRTHTGERPFMCGYCEKTFTSISHLKYHQRTHDDRSNEPKTYNFPCDRCDKKFTNTASLQRHQAIHTGIKPYQCNYCPAAFVLKTDLERHDMAHTGNKPFKCPFCDYSCVRKPILEQHMNSHTGNKPFKCDFDGCSAAYGRLPSLQKHKEKHCPPPPKTCKVCNEMFPDMKSLKKHMMIHPGNRPVPCDQCDKIFYNESTLKRHMHVHMYKPDGPKPKIVRQKSNNTGVKRARKPKDYQKNLSPHNQLLAATAAKGQRSYANSWTINSEDTNSQSSYHHSVFPKAESQFSNVNSWPSTMDPDELRRRLLTGFS